MVYILKCYHERIKGQHVESRTKFNSENHNEQSGIYFGAVQFKQKVIILVFKGSLGYLVELTNQFAF